ncbi:MAG: pre-peptidase C-terminal domain-containing protein, partial [Gemmatimonadetes bacterium]|nr:pre-peptidase C-terminal domain-containing protein [Gemmatimonadota bacterium]
SWSPDGRHLAFTSKRDGNNEIYVVGADGANPRNLTNHSASDGFASWSPDGRHLAFTSKRDGNWEIYVMGADGANHRRLTNHSADDFFDSWSPDGRHLAFTSKRDGNDEIYVMELREEAEGGGEADDHSNTRSGATSLTLGGPRSGEIDPGSDVDYFRVQVSESGTLTVYTIGSLDTEGTLENSSGSRLASNDDGGSGRNFRIERSVSAGTYYVKVESYSSRTGSYTIHASFSRGGGGDGDSGGGNGSCRVGLVLSPGEECTIGSSEFENLGGGCARIRTSCCSVGSICGANLTFFGFRATRVGNNFRLDAVP